MDPLDGYLVQIGEIFHIFLSSNQDIKYQITKALSDENYEFCGRVELVGSFCQ